MTSSRRIHWATLGLVAVVLMSACGGATDTGQVRGNENSTPDDTGGSDTASTPPGDAANPRNADTSRRLKALGTQGPQHLDPATGVFPCEIESLRWVYDSLIRMLPDGSLVPGLATSWESPEPRTFVLHLREGVQFQDGTEFNATAVKVHLERGKSHPESTIVDVLGDIQSIDTPDDHTVVLNLSAARAGILPQVFTERAGMIPSPAAVADSGDTYGGDGGVGAGPYAYDRHTPSEDFHVSSWDGYWDAENRLLAGIDLIGDAQEFQIQRIRDGSADYVGMKDAQLAEAKAAKGEGGIDYRITPTTQYAEIFIDWAVEPFDDVRVRQALNHALDRELLVEALTEGSGAVAWSPLPANSWAHLSDIEELYPFDPARARELLAEAGYPDGLTVTMGMIERPYYTRYAQAIQDMVRESGFRVELESVSPSEINNRIYQIKDLPVAITAFRGAADPGVTLEQKFGSDGNSNPAGTTVEGIDDLLAQGAAAVDQEERAVHYQEVERLVMENALSIPVFHNGGLSAFHEELKGVERGYTTCELGNFVAAPKWFEKSD